MLEKDKAEKGQDMHSPDLHDGNYAKCKTPSPFLQLICTATAANGQHKSSFPYVKILVPQFSFSKHGDHRRTYSKQLETSAFYPDLFPVARNFVIDRWNSELAYTPVF